MYDELIKRLREAAVYEPCIMEREDAILAADAIEELSKSIDDANEANIALYGALPKWIPVTERLPSRAGEYLTMFSKGEVGQNVFLTFRGTPTKWYYNSEDTGEVTHWMPLPEPPKGD